MEWSEWKESRKIGFDIGDAPIVFSNDKRKAFVVSNNDVIVVDVESGRREQILNHSSKIVGVHFLLHGKIAAYTTEGTECIWNTNTWTVLRCRELNCTPLSVWHFDEAIFVVTRNDRKELVVTKVNETSEEALEKQEILQTRPLDIILSQLSVTANYLVCCEKLFVYLYIYGEKDVKRFKYIGKAKFMDSSLLEFVSVTACGETVAAAISFGRVFIWNNVIRKGIDRFSQSVHWHKWAPCLALTNSGTLLSGGSEGVLAKFTLSESKSVAKPQLLPRLQAPVRRLSLSEDGSLVAAVLADNSVHFILNSTLNVFSSMHSILCSTKKSLLSLTEDPRYPNYVVHSARPGIIQWIEPLTMTSVATADISRENLVEAENIFCDSAGYTDVCQVAFSLTMVVTADCGVHFDIFNNRLQFWRRNEDLGSFALEHYEMYGDTAIKFVRASLEFDIFITVDVKGVMCTWERVASGERKWYRSNETYWMNVPVLHVSRIQKSHFAAVHDVTQKNEGVVVLWHVEEKRPLQQIHVHQGDGKLTAVEWGTPGTASLIIISSRSCIYAFNICTLSPLWIACEPDLKLASTSQFTVAYNKNVVSVIDCYSGTLLCQKKLTHIPDCVAAIKNDEMFSVITAYEKGYGLIAKSGLLEQAQKHFPVGNALSKTPFSNLLTVTCEDDKKNEIPVEISSNLDILSGPAYSLAPVPYLAQRFIRSCFMPCRRL